MALHGKNIIGQTVSAEGERSYRGVNPATGESLPVSFHYATPAEMERALALAERACHELDGKTREEKAAFLERIAAEIMGLGDELISRAQQETGLPAGRFQGERGRTVTQLRLFATLIREGSWVDARIDRAAPNRKPTPKPDVRFMLRPIGTAVVLCASNFPLAFSVAGGDTASALAAGNPVIVKAHHAHPGTAELVAKAVQKAAAATGMPQGIFSLLHGPGREVGMALVKHPVVKAVGFTGSEKGGRALFDVASSRPDPIPVYAEMGSTNPVFVLPGALRERAREIAAGLQQSVTLGVGQFCTNPGVVVLLQDSSAEHFIREAGRLLAETAPATMLHRGIREAYAAGVNRLLAREDVQVVGRKETDAGPGGSLVGAVMFRTNAQTFVASPELGKEVFGPCTMVVACSSKQELLQVAGNFAGQLAASVHASAADLEEYGDLLRLLETKAGRVIFNGFPTGVEVCHSMNHGGPYPATTDVHFTSVGMAAILRFARPICYQNFPQGCLPDELKDENPLKIWRLVDGKRTKGAITSLA